MNRNTLLALACVGVVLFTFETFVFSPDRAERKRKRAEYKLKKAEWDKAQKLKKELAEAAIAAKDPGKKANDDKAADKVEGNPTEDKTPSETPAKPAEKAKVTPSEPEKHFTISGEKFDVDLTNDGAGVNQITFSKIETSDHSGKLAVIHAYDKAVKCLALKLQGEDQPDLRNARWDAKQKGDEVSFSHQINSNQSVTKTIKATDKFHLEVELKFHNSGSEEWTPSYIFTGPAGLLEEYTARVEELQGVTVYKDRNGAFIFKNQGLAAIRDSESNFEDFKVDHKIQSVSYVGLYSKYFAALLMPGDQQTADSIDAGRIKAFLSESGTKIDEGMKEQAEKLAHPSEATVNQLIAQVVTSKFSVAPGKSVSHKYLLFCGPKGTDVVYQKVYAPYGVHKLRDYGFGFFSLPARVIAGLLRILYSIIGNYGFAIIILTIIVRLAMHPLTRASQVNMHRMQKIAPEMAKIKAKYEGKNSAEAKQKLSLESMELYRKHKVNPLAGCLPMFLQIPIFFSLYNVINYSYEIRHSPFIGWITDLSVADHLFDLPFKLPFHGTTAFSLLPLIMMVLYFVNSNMQPKSSDPQQAEMQKMMKFMLPLLGYLFYTMPSGLLLYFLTSLTGGILETYYIRNILLAEPSDAKPAEVKATKSKKSKS